MQVKRALYILSCLCFFVWWGGFTFYASFVVPTGMKVLGNHVLMGFITERVSIKLNTACAVAIAISLLYILWGNATIPRKSKQVMAINLLMMFLLLLSLSFLHVYMEASLDFEGRKVIEEPHFYFLHRIYLIISSIMWLQGIVHITQLLNIRIEQK
jgi:hypothetical protein